MDNRPNKGSMSHSDDVSPKRPETRRDTGVSGQQNRWDESSDVPSRSHEGQRERSQGESFGGDGSRRGNRDIEREPGIGTDRPNRNSDLDTDL